MKLIIKFFLLISIFVSFSSCSNKNTLTTISFLNVSQGDSSLIQHNNKNILIDTGEKKQVHNVISFLKKNKVRTIDYLILTHDHDDHAGGFLEISDSFKINKVVLPYAFKETTFEYVKKTIKNENILYIKQPTTISISHNFKLNFLSNFSKNPVEFNDSSLVFKASIDDLDILYTGDIEENAQLNLLSTNLESEILKVPHHGAYNNDLMILESFFQKVSPKISIISVGNNSYGHPNKNTLSIIDKLNSKILRTDEKGNITISIDSKNNTFEISSHF